MTSAVIPSGSRTDDGHFVRFYEDDFHLYNTVGRFLREGLDCAEGLVVIATPEHTEGFERFLREDGVEVAGAKERGDLTVLDARETLSRFLIGDLAGGVLDPDAFTRVVGGVVEKAAVGVARRKVRAYGEIVTLLFKQGNVEATVLLEELWNRLAQTHTFQLCCAYALDDFNRASHLEPFHRICAVHTHVKPAESYDPGADAHARDRQLAALQQRAAALEGEVAHRRQIEETLRRAQAERDGLLLRERAAREEAEKANRMKDEFLAIVSHELRTPLNAILGWTHVARAVAVPQPEQTRRALEVIERNARIQTQIVSDVLDISRITSGQLLLNPSQVDANHVVAAALESVRPSADARKITLEAALPADPLYLWADPDRMQQVLCNLLSNAVKFTPAGGRVAVTLAAHGPDTEITVTDTGKGIAPEFLPHVFERFRQADSSIIRSHGGLGLGLAIVNHLVELHHGRVEASSAGPGRGATFRVVLPLMVVAGEPVPASGRPAPRLDGVSALVVDDHEDGLELVAMILTQQGASVLKAKDAGRALSLLRENRPSVLVSDLEMPGESGYDLMEKIRALPASQGGLTPAIALTAYARSDDRLRALMAGFQAHLSKPTRPHELASAVAGLVGQTRTP